MLNASRRPSPRRWICPALLGSRLIVVLVWLASPAQALDLSNDILIYEENYDGEVAFPTTPETDVLSIGGLIGASDPDNLGPPPDLTGTSVNAQVSDTTTVEEITATLADELGTNSFTMRGEFSGLVVPTDTRAQTILIADFELVPSATDYPKLGMLLIVLGPTSPGPLDPEAEIWLIESDGMPPPFPPNGSLDNFLVEPLSLAETNALLAGASYVMDFRIDRDAEQLIGSIDIDGFPTHEVGPLALTVTDDSADIYAVVEGLSLLGSVAAPGTLVEVDMDAFQIYQPVSIVPVPTLAPHGLVMLVLCMGVLLGIVARGALWGRRSEVATDPLDR